MEINLSPTLTIPLEAYANQKNSITGMPGYGKTYTATTIAEQLMECGVPILVFDPIGVWQNLRYGTDGKPGYPVVVAGGMKADIELREDNVKDIILAAQKENVSLVIDLFGIETATKNKWISIVEKSVHHLLYTNQNYQLRHVFFEEAHEFIPQQTGPGSSAVVSGRIQSLATMGRNIGVGCTFITQRSEQLHKSVFEISHNVILHRQTGKNSLKAINEWLKLKGIEYKEVIETLPKLDIGECWLIQGDNETRMQIGVKKTFHPNPQEGSNAIQPTAKADVSAFITRMNMLMIKDNIASAEKTIKSTKVPNLNQNEYQAKITELENQVERLTGEVEELWTDRDHWQEKYYSAAKKIKDIVDLCGVEEWNEVMCRPDVVTAKQVVTELKKPLGEDKKCSVRPVTPIVQKQPATANPGGKLRGDMRILNVAAMYNPKPVSKLRVAAISGLSVKSGSFSTYLSTLKRNGWISMQGDQIMITPEGIIAAGEIQPLPTDWQTLVDMWKGVIGNGNGASKILQFLAEQYPDSFAKPDLAANVELSATSGSFSTYLSSLKKLGLVTQQGQLFTAAEELFEN